MLNWFLWQVFEKLDSIFIVNSLGLKYNRLRPVLLIYRAGSDKNKSFYLQIRESLSVPKQKLAYNWKTPNKAQKLSTYSD